MNPAFYRWRLDFPIKLINYILTVRLSFYQTDFQSELPNLSMLKNLSFIIHQVPLEAGRL